MITTGKVVALIQAMGGGADPAVIESAVQDWLDAHPEATTTVQDGSITEAKLATTVAQKLGLVSQLSDEIDDIGSDVTDLKSAFNDFKENTFEIEYGKNLFIPEDAEIGKYLELDGRITDYVSTEVTGFMPVVVGKYVTFSKKTSSGRDSLSVNTYLFYDASKAVISNSGGSWKTNIIVPSGAAFVRVTFGKTTEEVQIELTDDGTFTTPYEAYHAPVYSLDGDITIPAEQVDGITDAIETETVKGFNIVPVSDHAVGSAYGNVGSTIGKHPEDTTLHWIKVPIKPNTKYYTSCSARFITVTDENDIVLSNAGFYADFIFETDKSSAKYVYLTVSTSDWNNDIIIVSEGYSGAKQNVKKPFFIKGLNQLMDDSWFAVALTPEKLRFTVGIAEKLYYYNILSLNKNMIDISLGGTKEEDGYIVDTTTQTIDSNTYGYTVYDDNLSVVASVLRGGRNRKSVYVDNVSNCSALIIGDSIVARNGGKIGQTLLDAFSDRGKTITLLGTLGTGDNKNEGRAGWTTSDYFTNKQYEGVTNPFYNPTSHTFDFSYYANTSYANATGAALSSVDFVIIHLGGNDLFGSSFDGAREKIAQTEENIFAMIDSILSWNSNQKIIIQLLPTISPNYSFMNAVGGNAKLIRAKFVTYNAEMLVLLQKYGAKVRCSNDYMIIDPINDMADHIHPNDTGLAKIGMELVSQINCWQADIT